MFRAFVHTFALELLIIGLVVLLCTLVWFRKSRWPRRPKWMIALILNAVFGYPALWGIWIEFGCAREKAHSIICLSHIKRMGMAISMYTQNWDDTLPPASRWQDIIEEKVSREEDVFRCPESSVDLAYAFNHAMNRKSCNDLSDPTDYVMPMESVLNQRNAAGDHHALAPEPRHSGGDNYAFADGHAKWIRRDRAIPGKGRKPAILWKP